MPSKQINGFFDSNKNAMKVEYEIVGDKAKGLFDEK